MEFDRSRYAVITRWHWMGLVWWLNPFMVFNEIVLGQRIPKVFLIDKQAKGPLAWRQSVPCGECGAYNHGLLYTKTAFGNYAGIACAACGEEIASLRTALSAVILVLTRPLWRPVHGRVRARLLARQYKKLQGVNLETMVRFKRPALFMGASFGLVMGAFYAAQSWLMGQSDPAAILIGAMVAAILSGLVFGLTMKLIMFRGVRPQDRPPSPRGG